MANGGGAKEYQLPRMVHPVEKPLVRFRVFSGAIPLLDAMAEAGSSLKDSESHRQGMMAAVARFQEDAGGHLDKAITAHAKRYMDGSYRKGESGKVEENRQIGCLSLAIYLIDCVNAMASSVLQKGDAGTASLFESAFARISSFLTESHYPRSPGEVYSWYAENEPVISACLRRCGLEGRVMSLQGAIATNARALADRTADAFNRLQQ